MNNKHAGQVIVDSLALHGVERVFVVPGESYLAVLDGLHDSSIATVVCRHEGGAAYMAEAHGKFTGQPGVAMVTRGPGAANAFVALHTAWQDAVPMVLFVGLIPVADRMRESFQEFDPNAWFGTQCKRVFVLDEAERASEVVAEAFFAACSGRPGPVVVGLPEDVITHAVSGHEVAHVLADHGNERLTQQLGIKALLLLVGFFGEGDLGQQQLMQALGLGAQLGISLPFSRTHEEEADLMGLVIMARAGFDPQQSVELWRNMAAAGGGQPPEFLSTHPTHGSRIEALQKAMGEAMEIYRAATPADCFG